MITGNPMWDAAGSIAVGTLLVVVAVGVGIEVPLLIGQSAELVERARRWKPGCGRARKSARCTA